MVIPISSCPSPSSARWQESTTVGFRTLQFRDAAGFRFPALMLFSAQVACGGKCNGIIGGQHEGANLRGDASAAAPGISRTVDARRSRQGRNSACRSPLLVSRIGGIDLGIQARRVGIRTRRHYGGRLAARGQRKPANEIQELRLGSHGSKLPHARYIGKRSFIARHCFASGVVPTRISMSGSRRGWAGREADAPGLVAIP